jgi:histidine triad (HIT) family protein
MKTDPNCIFCKIVAREVPCARLLEDDAAMSFLDIGPLAQGHALLIPKEHYETLDQMPPEAAAAVLKHLPALAAAVQGATGCRGLNVLQNNGRVAHQFVPHVHFHIIPRNPDDEFQFNWPTGTYPEGRIEQLAEAIRSKLH